MLTRNYANILSTTYIYINLFVMVTKKSLLNVSFFVVTKMINQKQLFTRLWNVNLALKSFGFFFKYVNLSLN